MSGLTWRYCRASAWQRCTRSSRSSSSSSIALSRAAGTQDETPLYTCPPLRNEMLWRTILSLGSRSRDQPFRRTANGNAQLVNHQPFSEVFNVGIGPLAPVLSQHTLDITTGIEHANGVKVEPLGHGDRKHSLAHCFRNVVGNTNSPIDLLSNMPFPAQVYVEEHYVRKLRCRTSRVA